MEDLQQLARAIATRRDEERVHGIGSYFAAGRYYRHARGGVPVFVIMTPGLHRVYRGAP